MDSYDYNGVTYMPFTPYTGSSGYQQQQQSGGYYPYNDRSRLYGYGSVQDSMGSFVREPFTADFLWGMTFGTTVLMLVLCLALWCCLPLGLGSAAACYIRKYRKRPEKHVNGIVTIA
ncbi:hypothetical protein AAVH_43495 [Aphelenchoides avenae]|nr:hypothetical protein AAVH_43495 [Aphelenchus avenae]